MEAAGHRGPEQVRRYEAVRIRETTKLRAPGWWIRLALAAATVVTFLAVSPTREAGAASRSTPTLIAVTPSTQKPGGSVTVTGRGFPPDTNIQAQICGNDALNGSSDCVLSTSQEVSTTNKGLFQVPVVVTIPAKPCPCVVMVLDFSTSTAPTTPITIIGAPVATPSASRIHKLQVLNAYLEGSGPWTAWFGAPPQRTLVLTVRNPNPAAYVSPPLVLAIGNTSDTSTHEATTHSLSTIGPYGVKTYQIPVTFPAVAIGEHQVVGTVGNAGLSRSFEVQTWLFPWGLLLVILVLLEIILLLITRYFRERRRRREAAAAAAEAAGLAATPEGEEPPTGEVAAVGAAVGAGSAAGEASEAGAAESPPPRPPHPPVF